MREFHAFLGEKSLILSLTREFHASCVLFTLFGDFGKRALSLFIGILAFWTVGTVVASLGLS